MPPPGQEAEGSCHNIPIMVILWFGRRPVRCGDTRYIGGCCPDTRRSDARITPPSLRPYNFIPISTPADPHRHIYGLYGVRMWITTLDVYVVCVFVCVCVCGCVVFV